MSTINISDREIVNNTAIFSELSYRNIKNIKLPPGNWQPVEFTNTHTKISSIDGLDNPQTGYQARAWVNTDTRQIYFANTGTNDSKDAAGWLAAQRGVTSSQFTDALDAGLKVKEVVTAEDSKYRNYTIIVTGHSWGELMAQTLSYTFGWRGVGFDGPGAQAVISDPLYAQLTSERGIMPVGKSDFISCNIKNLGPLGGGIVGHIGTDIAGTRQCEITTDRIIEYSTLSFALAIVAANPIVGFIAGRFIGGLAQHGIGNLRSAVEKGNFSIGGDTLSPNTKVLPYEYQDGYGNRLCTLQDTQGKPLLNNNGQLLCQLTLHDGAGKTQTTQFTLDGALSRQTTTRYEQNQLKEVTFRSWLTDNIYQTYIYGVNYHTPLNSLNIGQTNYSLADFTQRSTAEYRLHQIQQSGSLERNSWHNFSYSLSNWLLSGATAWQTLPPGWGANLNLPSNWLNPIGAFYDSQSTAYDNAPSIADKTTRAMNAHGQALSASQLAALDSNQDGQLSASEAASVRLWADKNEDGRIDSGELLNIHTPIKNTDYAFYTRSNGQAASAATETMATAPALPILAAPVIPAPTAPTYTGVPVSNYWHWRSTAELFPTHSGFFMWQLNQVMLTWNKNQYDNLVGTEGNDTFDINYYASVPPNLGLFQNLHLVKNFMAGGGDDVMGGSDRSDNLWGGTGNDTLYGYAGDDKVYGEEGDDVLFGHDGNDLLDGGMGNDALLGGNGDDVLWGGDGNDELHGNDGNDKLMGQTGHDKLLGQGGDDHLWGGEGDDELQGGEGHDILMGESGNDRLFGQVGNDILLGGDGDDLLVGFTAGNEAKQSLAAGESDDDILSGGNGNDRLYGGIGDDQLMGDAGDDLLLGQAGNDRLWGGDGNDELQGGEGNDQLDGGSGNDKLFGQVGNDTLRGGDGDDVLVGFTMSNEAKQSLAAGESDDDVLSGGNGNDNLYGGVGHDQLMGDAGDDLLLGDDGHDRLWGGDGKDELQGGTGDDQLDGGDGDDRLFGQVGNDTIWGGAGNDLLMGFTGSNEAKQSLAAGETDDDILYGGAGSDVLIGGLGQDTLYGGDDRDELQGGAGDDLLFGDDGNDNLFGQVGNDILYGGDGDDYLQGFTASNETKQTLEAGESDDDFLYGGAGNDTLVGGLGNDYLDGGAGADIMIGGQGDDVYIVNSVNDTIYEKAGEGYDTVITSSNYLLNANIEELRLLEGFNIHGTGNALNNKIIGNSADNILDGVTGADTMIGGAGNDTYYVDNVGDAVIELNGEGTDTVQSSISYALGAHVENLVLLDFAKPEKGLVDGKAVLVYGYPKRNELDYMQGDAVKNYEGTCALTSIANLLTQAGRPTTESQVVNLAINNNWAINDPSLPAYQLGGTNVNDQRNLLYSYGLRHDIVMGYNEPGLANLLRSGRGVILGVNASPLWSDSGHINSAYIGDGAVNHAVTLTGVVYDEAKGTLAGFYLADSGRGKVSDMTRFVDIATFRNMANVPNAYALYTIEPVKYWQENIHGMGNELDNHIAGNRGDNILSGMAGNDLIVGEGGDDTLYGGAGNDTLYGGDGNDTLHGDEGNDILYGGAANDVYYFGRGDGSDTIIENDATPNNQDQVLIQSGVQAEQLWFKRESNNLRVGIIGTDDGVIIKDHYLGASHHIEQFKLLDGKVLMQNQVDKLVEAMAQFTPPAVGQTTLSTEYQKALVPIIAASWQ